MTKGWQGGENGHLGSAQRQTRWLTPRHIVEALGPFDLDPCGAPGHFLAERTYLLEEGADGLRDPWFGMVWCNPPYGKESPPFIKRLAEHGNGIAILFARTETAMWHEDIWPKASAILFLRGRVSFLKPDGVPAPNSSGAPSALIAYGDTAAERLTNSGIEGHLVSLKKVEAA